MINSETHTIEWILNLKNKLGRRIDPKLIEKVIWALTLLEQLKINGLNFTFKGATALLLATEKLDITVYQKNFKLYCNTKISEQAI
jgi:hypothetical protein